MSTSTYAAWVTWLEAFRRGDDSPPDHLGAITPAMGSYVEARLVDRIAVVFSARMRGWQSALGARIVATPPSGPDEAAALLREAAPRMEPLVRLASSPLLPAPLGASLRAALVEVRNGACDALQDAWQRQVQETGGRVEPVPAGARVPGPRTRGSAAMAPAPSGRARLVVPR